MATPEGKEGDTSLPNKTVFTERSEICETAHEPLCGNQSQTELSEQRLKALVVTIAADVLCSKHICDTNIIEPKLQGTRITSGRSSVVQGRIGQNDAARKCFTRLCTPEMLPVFQLLLLKKGRILEKI